jgi:hypothetical protein
MSGHDPLNNLIAKAREVTPPNVDVTANVLWRIRTDARTEMPAGPLFVFAGLSAAAAALIGVVSLQAWLAMQDPLAAWFSTVNMVMQ